MNGRTSKYDRNRSFGFSIMELLVVMAIIAILLGLLLPNMRFSTEAARRMSCANQLRQIGIALHSYHTAYDHLPMAMGGTTGDDRGWTGNGNRLSGLVGLLPFLEQQELWEKISRPMAVAETYYPPMGPRPWIAQYPPWGTEVSLFRCPADPHERQQLGRNNFNFCIGDVARNLHQPKHQRGMFACQLLTSFDDCTDGLAYTVAMTEIATGSDDRLLAGTFAVQGAEEILDRPSLCWELVHAEHRSQFKDDVPLDDEGRGGRWADGAAGFGLVNTILPPMGPSCAVGGQHAVDGIYSAGSYHPGGAHILMGDGSTSYISDSVDNGDPSVSPPKPEVLAAGPVESPFGVWGAMGTAAGDRKVQAE